MLIQKRTKKFGPSASKQKFALSFLLPSLVVAIAFLVYPLYLIVDISFREGKPNRISEVWQLPLTLDNYTNVFASEKTWNAISTTLVYAVCTVAGAVTLGLIAALLLRRKLPNRRLWRTLIMLPWPIPGAIASVTFMWMLDGTYGVFNWMLLKIGIINEPIAWFFNPETALFGVLLPTTWIAYPVCVLMILAGMQGIPDELYEAATVDGASGIQQFRYITLPGIKNSIALAILITGLWCLTTFDFVYTITRGGPNGATETLAVAIYNSAFRAFKLTEASALGVVTILLGGLLIAVVSPLMRKRFH